MPHKAAAVGSHCQRQQLGTACILLASLLTLHASLVQTTTFVSPPGTIIAFGANLDGRASPPATAANKIVAVSAGGAHTLALTAHGRVICFGDNLYGQCDTSNLPTNIVAISAGNLHSLALDSAGKVWAWGMNQFGESIVPAAATSNVVAISGSWSMSMALTATGNVVAWGGGPTSNASALTGIASLGGGGYYYLAAVNTAGAAVVVGNFVATDNNVWSLPAASQSGLAAVSSSFSHFLMLKRTGEVLVVGAPEYNVTSVPTAAQTGIVAISAGYVHSLALTSQGALLAWLYTDFNILALNYGQTVVPAAAQSGIAAVSAGTYHSAAIKGARLGIVSD